jgi:hypothetical protein
MHEKAMAALLAVQKLLPAPAVIPPAPVAQDTPADVEQRRTVRAERVRLFADASDPIEGNAEVASAPEQIRVGVTY